MLLRPWLAPHGSSKPLESLASSLGAISNPLGGALQRTLSSIWPASYQFVVRQAVYLSTLAKEWTAFHAQAWLPYVIWALRLAQPHLYSHITQQTLANTLQLFGGTVTPNISLSCKMTSSMPTPKKQEDGMSTS